MHRNIALFFICICLSSLLNANESKHEVEAEAQQKLEDWFEYMGLGVVEIGAGILQFTRGDPISGIIGIGMGVKDIKESVTDFNEAKDLFEKSREE